LRHLLRQSARARQSALILHRIDKGYVFFPKSLLPQLIKLVQECPVGLIEPQIDQSQVGISANQKRQRAHCFRTVETWANAILTAS
jgi:hypothetical protein